MAPSDQAPRALTPEQLYTTCDPETLPFARTDEAEGFTGVLGQDRAVEAVQFGIGIRRKGYNLFVHGPESTGRHSTVREFLDRRAAEEAVPSDWCLVNNFEAPHQPLAIELPAGRGVIFRDDIATLLEELGTAIPSVFEAEDYRARRQAIDEAFKERQEEAFDTLQERAREFDIALVRTQMGFALAPMKDGDVIAPEAFKDLDEAARDKFEADLEVLQKELQETVQQLPIWDKERRERIRDLNREVTMYAVGHSIDALREAYDEFPRVTEYLTALQGDVVSNADAFMSSEDGGSPLQALAAMKQPRETDVTRRYVVNLLVDNAHTVGAPVVYEDMPSYANLIGRIEHISQMGALVTDFGMIKAGSLHRANGGYLLIDAYKLLSQPYAYEALKRAITAGSVRIESLGQVLSLVSTVSLEPEPIPIDVKVVLIGPPRFYYMLNQLDPEFADLFKVSVDYGWDMPRRDDNTAAYANLIATLAAKEDLKTFDAAAVARLIEFGAREADNAGKLSTQMGHVADVMREADYWSRQAGNGVVGPADVQAAIDARIRRVDALRERSHEAITEGLKLIDTDGAKVGQINGLSVLSLGAFAFGGPSRITARVRLGKGRVVDIEREVELGGPIHSKGVLILSSFLGGRFVPDRPLSLSASLVFEQSYGGVDGDSASSAELYALLSALSDTPIRQCFAVTGSVNQLGEVQAIGGVNEKIEGFFDICSTRGLSGEQGVLIPASNVRHLMLRADVVDACRAGQFQVIPVATVDEGIEILTGKPAGARDGEGLFPAGSINQLVEQRLSDMAEDLRKFGQSPDKDKAADGGKSPDAEEGAT